MMQVHPELMGAPRWGVSSTRVRGPGNSWVTRQKVTARLPRRAWTLISGAPLGGAPLFIDFALDFRQAPQTGLIAFGDGMSLELSHQGGVGQGGLGHHDETAGVFVQAVVPDRGGSPRRCP